MKSEVNKVTPCLKGLGVRNSKMALKTISVWFVFKIFHFFQKIEKKLKIFFFSDWKKRVPF